MFSKSVRIVSVEEKLDDPSAAYDGGDVETLFRDALKVAPFSIGLFSPVVCPAGF